MNDEAVCRTAPATPGLLKRLLRRLQAQILPDATPPIGKIHPFSKIVVTLECPEPVKHNLFYDWKHHLNIDIFSMCPVVFFALFELVKEILLIWLYLNQI